MKITYWIFIYYFILFYFSFCFYVLLLNVWPNLQCTIRVNDAEILEPKCSFATPRPKTMNWGRKFFDDIPEEIIQSPTKRQENWCQVILIFTFDFVSCKC